jgi:S-adenosylmethionine synthetase
MTRSYTFTSESVTEGHPDKMADQVSDAVLDAILAEDPQGRVACETLLTTGLCVVAGEITTSAYVDIPKLARSVIKDIGYDNAAYGFDGNTCGVIISIDEQSPDIAKGVDVSEEVRAGKSGEDRLNAQGAGDQGMMFGYACDETPELMPLPIHLAHRLAEQLAEVRKSGAIPYLRPDGKTQVTFDYEDGRPVRLRTVLISTQHADGINRDTVIRPDLIEQVIRPTVPEQFANDDYAVYVNPTGEFVKGGPHADTGLTGRKIIVDTFGTNVVDELVIERAVRETFDLRPAAILRDLDLKRPIFRQTAAYGHFGRTGSGFTWEQTSRLAEFTKKVGL